MFYVKYKLRETEKQVIPKGPNFKWARRISCDIDGTTLSFRVPKHRPRRAKLKPLEPARSYKLDDMIFRSNYEKGFKVSDNWETFEFFHNSWTFNGPWFTGTLAELWMYLKLVKPVNHESPDFSLFHPRAFEKIIGDYLTNEFSTYIDENKLNKYHYIAPVNWQPFTTLPVVATKLKVIPDESVAFDSNRFFLFFPITDQVMACIQFIPTQFGRGSQEERDKRVSRSTMYELMDQIINSFELKLSPAAIERQKAALKGLDDASLVKDYSPLKWDRPAGNDEAKKLEP